MAKESSDNSLDLQNTSSYEFVLGLDFFFLSFNKMMGFLPFCIVWEFMDVLAGNWIGVDEGVAIFCGDFAVEEFLRVVIFDGADVKDYVTSSGVRICFFLM